MTGTVFDTHENIQNQQQNVDPETLGEDGK